MVLFSFIRDVVSSRWLPDPREESAVRDAVSIKGVAPRLDRWKFQSNWFARLQFFLDRSYRFSS